MPLLSLCAALTLNLKLFRQLLQLVSVKSHLLIVTCIQRQKLHCHDAATIQCSTGATWQSDVHCNRSPCVLL